MTSRTIESSIDLAFPLQPKHDRAALGTSDGLDDGVARQAVGRRAVDGQHYVAGEQAGAQRGRVANDLEYRQAACLRDGLAEVALGVLRVELRTYALELPADAGQARLVLLLRHVRRERIAERREQALDRALDKDVLVLVADVVLGDVVVGVPEGLEERLARQAGARRQLRLAAEQKAGGEQPSAAKHNHQNRRGIDRQARLGGLPFDRLDRHIRIGGGQDGRSGFFVGHGNLRRLG